MAIGTNGNRTGRCAVCAVKWHLSKTVKKEGTKTMERDTFERVISENWERVARQRYVYNGQFSGEDAAQEAVELMLRQYNDGQFDGYDEKQLVKRFYELARRRNRKQFEKYTTRMKAEAPVTAQDDRVFDQSQIMVDSRELIEMIYGESIWVAESLMDGNSLNETARLHGCCATTVKNRQKVAIARARELASC